MSEGGPAEAPLSLTGTVFGRYSLERLLGEGGMGVVYAARHRELGRAAAVKILHERYDQSESLRARFLREGQAASRIRHPNIVDVYDVGTEGRRAYLVMELLDGEDLRSLIAREGALPVERIADFFVPVVSALAAAHEVGIVHRDLKPDNIFLSAERTTIIPKVLDFGISKVNDPEKAASLTGTGTLLGTPYYMSPEQAQTEKHIDSRSDQYSVGVILYECVTGRRPIEEPSLYALIQRIVHGDYPAPRQLVPGIPVAFEQIIQRAMARNPADRFASTRALGRALLPFASERVRANYAEDLAHDEIPAPARGSDPPRTSEPALQTTLRESVHERDNGRKLPPGRSGWLGRAALAALGVALLGALLWRASQSKTPGADAPSAGATPAIVSATSTASASEPAPPPRAPSSAKSVTSEPPGAAVWIGGVNVGVTPRSVEVPAGQGVEVELRLAGFETSKRRLTSDDPESIRIDLVREKAEPKPTAAKRVPRAPDRPSLAPR